MRVMVLGGGGREHALAWRMAHDGAQVLVAPGSDGIAREHECAAVDLRDHAAVVALARARGIELCVVGPEQPLVDGVADALRAAAIPCFGPGAAAARLEGSKVDAKQFMDRHGIPTARCVVVRELAALPAALASFELPPVVKADGLAAGKGVVVAQSFDEAEQAARACLSGAAFGAAGVQIVLEQRLVGEEVSLFVVTDGRAAVVLAPAQDHKRIGDGDTGPNTGGMGAYVPAPVFDATVRTRALTQVVEPTLAGLRHEGRPFVGVLFVGLMIDAQSQPWVIEYNCRFGDPEVQALVWGASEPLLPHLAAAARGQLAPAVIATRPAATVVLAAAGYPGTPRAGDAIAGLEAAAVVPETKLFHAGTRHDGHGFRTAGGRVLGVCARGDTLPQALARAYEAAGCVHFDGMQLRRDVGARALARS